MRALLLTRCKEHARHFSFCFKGQQQLLRPKAHPGINTSPPYPSTGDVSPESLRCFITLGVQAGQLGQQRTSPQPGSRSQTHGENPVQTLERGDD